MWRLIFIVNLTLPTVPFDICELVDSESMPFVNWSAVKLLGGRDSLLRRLIFDEGIARLFSRKSLALLA